MVRELQSQLSWDVKNRSDWKMVCVQKPILHKAVKNKGQPIWPQQSQILEIEPNRQYVSNF